MNKLYKKLLGLAIILCGFIQAFAQDPFTPYLDGHAPAIAKELGTEQRGDSVILRKVLIHSRDVQTESGVIASNLFAVIAHPVKPGRYPGILVLHGGGGSAEVEQAARWAGQGYIAVALDEPGIANPEKAPLSEGAWKKYPYGQHRFTANPDITASTVFDGVVAGLQGLYLLKDQPDVIKDRVGIVGISWGGYLTTMLTGLVGARIHTSFSVFGSGFYDHGSSFLRELDAMPPAEKTIWLQYLDAGRRISSVKTPYFLAGPTDDNFFYPPAVMATLQEMKGKVNHVFAPNANHKIPLAGGSINNHASGRPGWLEMEQTWFDFYLKGIGKPFPQIEKAEVVSSKPDTVRVRFKVKSKLEVVDAQVWFSGTDQPWTKRTWKSTPAVKMKDGWYYADILLQAREAIDWFASAGDARPVTVSSMMLPGK